MLLRRSSRSQMLLTQITRVEFEASEHIEDIFNIYLDGNAQISRWTFSECELSRLYEERLPFQGKLWPPFGMTNKCELRTSLRLEH